MTRRRLRWVAVQSVVVTVLAVVVVLTLLKPESNSPLSGISGGNETTPTIAQGPTGSDQGGPNQGGPNGGGNGAGNNGQGANDGNGNRDGNGQTGPGDGVTAQSGSVPVAPTSTPPPPAASPIVPGDETDGDSPTVDQYADTLGRLDAALN